MSDYGLLVKNNNEEIQIDSTYRNLSLDESGTAESITNPGTSGVYYTSLSITSSDLIPLFLMQPNTTDFFSIKAYGKTGTAFDTIYVTKSLTAASTINWQCYRENRTASSENYGLLVYNQSDKLVFDSGKKYFKIHSTYSISLSNPPNDGTAGDYADITHSGIEDPYYILSPGSFYESTVLSGYYPPPLDFWKTRHFFRNIGIKKLSSTSVRVGWFIFYTYEHVGTPYVAAGYNPTMRLLVCNTL